MTWDWFSFWIGVINGVGATLFVVLLVLLGRVARKAALAYKNGER